MAQTNTFNTRIQHKHDVEVNWLKATTFAPKAGELIIYDVDETHSSPRFKVGDGTTLITDLPFSSAPSSETKIITYTANLSMDGWTDNTDYASQTVTVSGILATDNPIIDLNISGLSETAKQAVDNAWCEVYYISTAENSITVHSRSIPTTDILIQLQVVR